MIEGMYCKRIIKIIDRRTQFAFEMNSLVVGVNVFVVSAWILSEAKDLIRLLLTKNKRFSVNSVNRMQLGYKKNYTKRNFCLLCFVQSVLQRLVCCFFCYHISTDYIRPRRMIYWKWQQQIYRILTYIKKRWLQIQCWPFRIALSRLCVQSNTFMRHMWGISYFPNIHE